MAEANTELRQVGLDIRPGTVSLLALRAIARAGPLHGFQVLRWIGEVSAGELLVEEGALPAWRATRPDPLEVLRAE